MASIYLVLWARFLQDPTALVSIMLGLWCIAWAGHVQHEASHNAISKRPWINYLGRFLLYPFMSTEFWHLNHNVHHHSYTNMDQDADFAAVSRAGIARFSTRYLHFPAYTWQVLYVLAAFPLVVYRIGVYNSLCRVAQGGNAFVVGESLVHVLTFFGLHAYMWYRHSIVHPLLLYIVWSTFFLVVSQVNHINERSARDEPARKKDFCINQIESATNYKTSAVAEFLCIGLSRQIEHHLFPGVSSEHHPAVQRIVRQFCQTHAIEYNEVSTFYAAFRNYLQHLHACSMAQKS